MHSISFNGIHGIIMIFIAVAFLSLVACQHMAVEEERDCPCTTDVVQFSVDLYDDPHPCEFELPTDRDVEWLLFSYT